MVPLVVHAIIRTGMIDVHQPRLDHGGGKELSLPECPREQLEKEVKFRFISVVHDILNDILTLTLLHPENHVSEIQPFPFTICSDIAVADISPLNNVGRNFPGRGGSHLHTFEQD